MVRAKAIDGVLNTSGSRAVVGGWITKKDHDGADGHQNGQTGLYQVTHMA